MRHSKGFFEGWENKDSRLLWQRVTSAAHAQVHTLLVFFFVAMQWLRTWTYGMQGPTWIEGMWAAVLKRAGMN